MPNNFAVIETGGKQYKVSPGEKIKVEKLGAGAKDGAAVFDKVLLRADGERVEIGAPYLVGAKIHAKSLGAVRGDKQIAFRYHSKTRQRRKMGHRQEYTEVQVQ